MREVGAEVSAVLVPLHITFRGMSHSAALEAHVRRRADKLDRYFDRITACRVVVELAHRHHRQGQRYRVSIDMVVPRGELAGEFDADMVQLSGTVRDNTVIRAKSLEVKLSPPNGKMQVIFGESELEVGSEHSEKTTGASERPPKGQSVRPAGEPAASEDGATADANGAG